MVSGLLVEVVEDKLTSHRVLLFHLMEQVVGMVEQVLQMLVMDMMELVVEAAVVLVHLLICHHPTTTLTWLVGMVDLE